MLRLEQRHLLPVNSAMHGTIDDNIPGIRP